MRPRAITLARWLLPVALLTGSVPRQAAAEAEPSGEVRKAESPSATAGQGKFPGDVTVEALKIREVPGADEYILEGAATIRSGRSRLQADKITYRGGRFIEAEGNVLIVWGGNRISGARMTYDLKEERGEVLDAIGQVEPEFYFVAKRAEKVGQDTILLDSAIVTTCTQPVPYWSLPVSSARIHINGYAHMWNLRLRARRLPIFYTPYLIWPVKKGRSAGLMIPSFGTTKERGNLISEELYIPIGDSVDFTLGADRYSKAGTGWATDLSFIPNAQGSGRFTGFFIDDQVSNSQRYRLTYQQTQKMQNGFRMVADVNQVSDFNYFTDYERDLRLVSMPTILARVEFSRNGSWTSLNVREQRREQLRAPQPFYVEGQVDPVMVDSSVVQETLPDIEWRGRSQRLGKTPIYLSFESSLASIRQNDLQFRTGAYCSDPLDPATCDRQTYTFPLVSDYFRADAYPTLSAPFSPFPWLAVTPSVNARYTHYTQRQAARVQEVPVGEGTTVVGYQQIVSAGLDRWISGAGVEMVGPKLFRIFDRPSNPFSIRYKHVFEPRISWAYQQAYDRNDEIIPYDGIDAARGASNQLTYGFRTRLFAQRPRAKAVETPGIAETVLVPEGTSGEVKEAESSPPGTPGAAHGPPSPPPPMEPVEIASLEVSQSRSFGKALSILDINGDGIPESSWYSAINTVGRFNPNPHTSLDLRMSYDVLSMRMTSVSVSGNLRSDVARTGFSVVRTQPSTIGAPTQVQLRLAAGTTLFERKLKVDVDGSYDAQTHRVPDQRWKVEYYTQCCGFLMEWFKRDFISNNRGEFRFTVDLRGVGKLMDLRQ